MTSCLNLRTPPHEEQNLKNIIGSLLKTPFKVVFKREEQQECKCLAGKGLRESRFISLQEIVTFPFLPSLCTQPVGRVSEMSLFNPFFALRTA